jgi:hypothetical protein
MVTDQATEAERPGRRAWQIGAFGLVCAVCIAGAAVVMFRDSSPTGGDVQTDDSAIATLQSGPHSVFVDTRLEEGGYGHVGLVDPAVPDQIEDTPLVCDRVDMAADRGVCLQSDRGVLTTYKAVVFDDRFQTLESYDLPGIPSRTRVSPNGDLGAWTTFVSGDSYLSQGLSTRTHLVNLRTGEEYGDLEKFTVIRDGKTFSEPDFNFWGVSFDRDGNTFYATLSTGGHQYLVQGDLAGRTVTILQDGVECPSLSPDGMRVVFKKRVTSALGHVEWRLSVLDLATLEAHELAEERNVDDQAAWLDNDTVTYGVPHADSGTPTKDTYSVPADGSGTPQLLVAGAWSLGQVDR